MRCQQNVSMRRVVGVLGGKLVKVLPLSGGVADKTGASRTFGRRVRTWERGAVVRPCNLYSAFAMNTAVWLRFTTSASNSSSTAFL